MNILTVKNVRKDYFGNEETLALEDISFEVKKGEFLSIVGPSGCGKTTLLKIMAGLLSTTSGEVLVEEKKVDGPAKESVLVFQEYNRSLLPWRSVLKNVEFALEVRDWSEKDRRLKAEECLKMVGLDEFAQYYPWELSGGMQQRVAIARAIAYEPEILLMDEPFGSLDARTRHSLENELLKLWEDLKITILFVTHDIDEAIYLSDRLVIFSSRPAKILENRTISLERPRNQLETRSSKDFIKYRYEVYNLLRQEEILSVEAKHTEN